MAINGVLPLVARRDAIADSHPDLILMVSFTFTVQCHPISLAP